MKEFNTANLILAGFLALIVMAAAASLLLQAIIVPLILHSGMIAGQITSLPQGAPLAVDGGVPEGVVAAEDSPVELNISMTPTNGDTLDDVMIHVIADNSTLETIDCPLPKERPTPRFYCPIPLKFKYLPATTFDIYPVIVDERGQTAAKPFTVKVDWSPYLDYFWSVSLTLAAIAAIMMVGSAAFILLALFLARKTVHATAYAGEYSLKSVFLPFFGAKTTEQRYWGFLSSSAFWAVEIIGIVVLVAYMAIGSDSLKSAEALFAFLVSGLISLPLPLVFVTLFWYADYKEREPISIMVSLFLWGGVACLLAVGVNSIVGGGFEAVGAGFLTAILLAPFVEELFKGTGLVLFSFHHEFDDVVDGILYGLTIGMGFTFIEDWLYLVQNPVGGDMTQWFTVFAFRSLFELNHGIYTACTGAVIGYLKQKNISWSPYGLLIGMIPAAFLHFMHNLVTLAEMFGPLGILYLVTILPLFDYGGTLVILAIMAYGIYKAKKAP
jgi:RsiW-degrading membrane proteinase PrsW (M82 family)